MSRKRELLELEDKGWHELCARFDAVPPDAWEKAGAAGDWSPKDVMAHIACWHAEAARQFEAFRVSEAKPWWADIETFNRESHERCAEMTSHEVRAMSGAAQHRFREEVAHLAEPLPPKFERWIAMFGSEHYEEHVPLLDAFLGANR